VQTRLPVISLILGMFLCAVLAGSAQTFRPRWEVLGEQADAEHGRGNIKSALDWIHKAIEAYRSANVGKTQPQFEEKAQKFEKEYKERMKNFRVQSPRMSEKDFAARAQEGRKLGEFEEALSAINEALKGNPGRADYLSLRREIVPHVVSAERESCPSDIRKCRDQLERLKKSAQSPQEWEPLLGAYRQAVEREVEEAQKLLNSGMPKDLKSAQSRLQGVGGAEDEVPRLGFLRKDIEDIITALDRAGTEKDPGERERQYKNVLERNPQNYTAKQGILEIARTRDLAAVEALLKRDLVGALEGLLFFEMKYPGALEKVAQIKEDISQRADGGVQKLLPLVNGERVNNDRFEQTRDVYLLLSKVASTAPDPSLKDVPKWLAFTSKEQATSPEKNGIGPAAVAVLHHNAELLNSEIAADPADLNAAAQKLKEEVSLNIFLVLDNIAGTQPAISGALVEMVKAKVNELRRELSIQLYDRGLNSSDMNADRRFTVGRPGNVGLVIGIGNRQEEKQMQPVMRRSLYDCTSEQAGAPSAARGSPVPPLKRCEYTYSEIAHIYSVAVHADASIRDFASLRLLAPPAQGPSLSVSTGMEVRGTKPTDVLGNVDRLPDPLPIDNMIREGEKEALKKLEAELARLLQRYADRFWEAGEKARTAGRENEALEDYICHWAAHRGKLPAEQNARVVSYVWRRTGFELQKNGANLLARMGNADRAP